MVVHSPTQRAYPHSHERATGIDIAKRIASLKGLEFAGEYDRSKTYPGLVYFVPSDTLVGFETAKELGIRGEHDLFGGVVPHAFVATKVITHRLVDENANAPPGWSHEFGHRVHDSVLLGFSAFGLDDARRAGTRLLGPGPVRIKPVRQTGGRGQIVASTAGELLSALEALDPADISSGGIVLEQDLTDVRTSSVGHVVVADLVGSYYGVQLLTRDNNGALVYGGSELVVARGGFEALLLLDPPEEARLAVAQARAYDAAARECFPGLFSSRRNYDIARGLDAQGRPRSGVLEQSWRIGGASGAEIAALEAFGARPTLKAVRASSIEAYGESEPPPGAAVSFRGIDDRVGPITKYTLLEPP